MMQHAGEGNALKKNLWTLDEEVQITSQPSPNAWY